MPTSAANSLRPLGLQARKAAALLAASPGAARRHAVLTLAEMLGEHAAEILAANAADVEEARSHAMSDPLLKRLQLNVKDLDTMGRRLRTLADLPDSVGRILSGHTQPDGLRVEKLSVPIGVIGIIYESRPNVTTDAAAVCLKSGNAVVLRGGSEAIRSNVALADLIAASLSRTGLPPESVQMIRTTDRSAVGELLRLDEYVDVIIPRGGKALIERIAAESRIPVIKHYDGICHQYLAADAPTDMAVSVSINSKCQRLEVCNALETLLVDRQCASRLLPPLRRAFDQQGITLRGCDASRQILPDIEVADDTDWATEYLGPLLALRVVNGIEEAIAHINHWGSGHTDGIVTLRSDLADRFVAAVDSASVLVNASTRLSGGADYGLGAVVGISTDRLHARGPVGPDELTSYKWVARGQGHLRQ